MCGEHLAQLKNNILSTGSSPHVRGAPSFSWEQCVRAGIIPACAGSTLLYFFYAHLSRDHPRMCGEHRHPPVKLLAGAGSSPHVRGAPDSRFSDSILRGIIPACAGSTRVGTWRIDCRRDHPRMCGEHALFFEDKRIGRGSSPHVRGAPT